MKITPPRFPFLTSISLSCALGCAGEPRVDDGWEVATPEAVGVDAAPLLKLAAMVTDGPYDNVHGVLLVKAGKLVFEHYFDEYSAERLHYTASVSKSVGSLLVGIAIDRGLLRGGAGNMDVLDRPVAELFSDYAALIGKDPAKAKLHLRHVLSMSAGLQWDEASHPYGDQRNDCTAMERSDDPLAVVFGKRVVEEPGTSFLYNGGLSILLSALVTGATDQKAGAFAADALLEPLGVTEYRWDEVANGLTNTDGGLHLRPRDMAKIGRLVLDEGRWEGQQIVSQAWIKKSTRRRHEVPNGPGYGFQWWCGLLQHGGKTYPAIFASGHGGQKIIVLPTLDAVVVFTHQVFENPLGDLRNLAMLAHHVLPALAGAGTEPPPSTPAPAELQKYVGTYEAEDGGSPLVVALRDGGLIAHDPQLGPQALLPHGEHRFHVRILDMLEVPIVFVPDGTGGIKGARSHPGFRARTFRKR